jgi:hypothetical protein
MAKLTNKELYRQEYKKLMRRVRYNEKAHGVVVLQSSLPKPNPKYVTKGMIEEVNQIRRSNLLMISEVPMSNTTSYNRDIREVMPDTFSSVALDRFYKIVGKYPNSVSQDIMYTTVKGLVTKYGEDTVGSMLANMTEQGIVEAMVYGSKNTEYGEQWIDEFMSYLPDEPQLQEAREQLLEQQEGDSYDTDFVDATRVDVPF